MPAEEGLAELVHHLRGAAEEVGPKAAAVVKRGGLNIKRHWIGLAKAIDDVSARAYPFSLSFDMVNQGDRISAVIGPDKSRRQGALGNLLEYGGAGAHNHPQHSGDVALDAEEENFKKYLGDLGEGLLE